MSSYPNVLNGSTSEILSKGFDDDSSSHWAGQNRIQKEDVKVVDITRQQWFWDQAVLS